MTIVNLATSPGCARRGSDRGQLHHPAPRRGPGAAHRPRIAPTSTAVVDAASFDTGNPRRDKDVRSTNFLAAEAYPDISFTSTELAADAAGNWTLTGSLTVRDATSNLTLILGDASGHRFRATTRIDRYAFGVTRGKGMAARYLDLDLDIVLR